MVHAVNEKPESLKGCNSSTITQEGDSHIKLFISLATGGTVAVLQSESDLGNPKQNEDKLHEDQGDDPRPSCKISPSTLI